ncbi:MAG: hypothetical protein R6W06_04920 [Prochlorococcaceae cyanobacterium]
MALAGQPLLAMPSWELIPPPPPLPPIVPEMSAAPKASTSKPAAAKANSTASAKPEDSKASSAKGSSNQASSTKAAPPLLNAGLLRWEVVDSPSKAAAEVLPTPVATPALNPSTGFPTLVSTSNSGTGLLWELAPTPGTDSRLLALATGSTSLETSQLDTNQSAPEPLGIEPPAPTNTASILRWELVGDPNAVLAEQPDPESLTTPVALRYQPPFLLGPYLGGGVPSAYVAGWGDFYFGASAATPGKLRDGDPDGSFNVGMGFGDADKLVAIELDWGIGSVKNFNFNGGFSGAIGRNLIRNGNIQLAISAGVIEFYDYGNESDDEPPSPYGALSLTVPLRPDNAFFQQRLQLNLGGGGAAFAWQNEDFTGPDAGFFASLGLELTRNTGISAAWSGRGMNANFSYVPFRDIPVSVNVLAADVFNASPYGRVGVLTVTWGSNFANGVF